MYINTMYKKLDQVIVKHPKDAFINQQHLQENWEKYFYLAEPNFDEAVKEFDHFIALLKNEVREILYLKADTSVGLDSIYAHDPVKFTPNGAIILKSGKIARQSEAIAYKKFLQDNNIAIIGELTGDAVCDGGDIVWLNDQTIAIGRSYRTNDEAIRQLTEIVSPMVDEVKVIQLPHDLGEDACLHLMSFISIVDKDLAVVYSRLMPVALRQWLVSNDFELIEVPEDEYDLLGCNVLAIAPRVCIIPDGNPVTKQRLLDAGARVHSYKGDEITVKGTGGPTCLTSPVIRR
ncbi:dimethylarginine dimethylaminohydrolase family protein [Kurthia sibirica]|uniref:Amidinotransferase n=1 Tax=Kurthia sibirica TaxID=202750 RepID=A0A2U3AI01_9BACL|nr:arginine deiminase family protein [Kurthia sibirica]PWI24137.1 amidinotransferase [Kurthia sibirica]GEK35489.1 amidinotransferase [Kurthia sibirica]